MFFKQLIKGSSAVTVSVTVVFMRVSNCTKLFLKPFSIIINGPEIGGRLPTLALYVNKSAFFTSRYQCLLRLSENSAFSQAAVKKTLKREALTPTLSLTEYLVFDVAEILGVS